MASKNAPAKQPQEEYITAFGVYAGSNRDPKGRTHMKFNYILDEDGKKIAESAHFIDMESTTDRPPRLNEWVRFRALADRKNSESELEFTLGTLEEFLTRKDEPIASYLKTIPTTKTTYELDWDVEDEIAKRVKEIIPPKAHLSEPIYYPRPIRLSFMPRYWKQFYLEEEGLDEETIERRKRFTDLNTYSFRRLILEFDGSDQYREKFKKRIVRHFLIEEHDINAESQQFKTLLMYFMALALKVFHNQPEQIQKVLTVFSAWNNPFKKRFRGKGCIIPKQKTQKTTHKKTSRKKDKDTKGDTPILLASTSDIPQPKERFQKRLKRTKPRCPTPQNPTSSQKEHSKKRPHPTSLAEPKVVYDERTAMMKERFGKVLKEKALCSKGKSYISEYAAGKLRVKPFRKKINFILKLIRNPQMLYSLSLKTGNILNEKGNVTLGNHYLKRAITLKKRSPPCSLSVKVYKTQEAEEGISEWKKDHK